MQNVALLGFGTVGASVARILDERVSDVNLTSILVRAGKEHVDPRATSDFDALLSDPALDTVVECMGGLTPAYEYIKAALTAKKNVVTSNKAVVSAYFEEFMTLAAEAGVNFKIEACVCGGIPWIAGIQKVRRIDEISAFWGIMNGTTNYIVYSMLKDGTDFAEVLSKAQELGYAERDPSSDIDGIDVRSKTMISASIAFDVICTDQIPMSGIRNLTKRDLAMFGSHDMTIKLFGRGVSDGSSYAVAVEPVAVSLSTIEANVPTNFNVATAVGNTIGELKFYGQGAGGDPTANAVVQDIIDCAAAPAGGQQTFSAGLSYNPELLVSDYVFRTQADIPGGTFWEPGAQLVKNLSAEKACELLTSALSQDPTTFMAALEKRN